MSFDVFCQMGQFFFLVGLLLILQIQFAGFSMTSRHQVNAKSLERRVCRALGGERRGPNPGSDCVGTHLSVEVKRMKVLSLRKEHLDQAKRQSIVDGKPWVLVIAEHGATLEEALVVQPFLPWAEKEMRNGNT